MKTLSLITTLFFFVSIAASAQETDGANPRNKTTQVAQSCHDQSVLDKVQKETEDISMVKPILFIASIIEERLELRRLEKESIERNQKTSLR